VSSPASAPYPKVRARAVKGAAGSTASERVGLLISRCRLLMWRTVTQRLEGAGQSLHLYRLLSELVQSGPRTQRELAMATAQHAAAVSRLVEELVAAGLIRRRRSARDRRQMIIAITSRGRARHRMDHPIVAAGIADILRPLSPAEQQRLAGLLEKVLRAHDYRSAAPRRAGLVQSPR
jgi:DNA-binding MarR family transcriptional regulator